MGLQWDRPWAIWLTPLLAIAWWLLIVARRPRLSFTGAHALWPDSQKETTASHRRGWFPTRFWEWVALLLAGLALAGPAPSSEVQVQKTLVWVDRSPSMYLEESGGTRLALALERLKAWDLAGKIQFVDAGNVLFQPGDAWPSDWDRAPEVQRAEVSWALRDRPDGLWLTDRFPEVKPLHASVLAVGGTLRPGPVALAEGGLLSMDGAGSLQFEAAEPARILGGNTWPTAWVGFAELWGQDRGLQWGPGPEPEPEVVFELSSPESSLSGGESFELEGRGYLLRGRMALLAPKEVAGEAPWVPGPWLVKVAGGESSLLFTRPGQVRLQVLDWEPIQGDLAAFAVDLARTFDRARVLRSGLVSRKERAAVAAGEWRNDTELEPGAAGNQTPSSWATWLAIGALLCLLASFGARPSRR